MALQIALRVSGWAVRLSTPRTLQVQMRLPNELKRNEQLAAATTPRDIGIPRLSGRCRMHLLAGDHQTQDGHVRSASA
jgi:hypothetical protein